MKIKISSVSGFCMGVKKAIDNVLEAAHRKKGAIYVDGPVIHNPQVIRLLEEKGVAVLPDDAVLQPADTVVIRAHGIPPAREAQFTGAGCTVIDSTCPLVARIQKIIAAERAEGRRIVIVGEKGHPEVIGLAGYAADDGLVIESEEESASVPADRPVALVAQSTQDIDRFSRIAERIRAVVPDTIVHDTICRATRQRQEAVKQLAEVSDAVIVVGGRNSGNTKRLAEIAGRRGPTFHVETEEELDPEALQAFDRVGIAGGASTPNWMIIRIKDRLERIAEDSAPFPVRLPKQVFRFLVNSNLLTAAAGAALAGAYYLSAGIRPFRVYTVITFLYLFAMHTLNRFIKFGSYRFNSPARASFFEKTKAGFITAGAAGLLAASIIAYLIDLRHMVILLLCSLPGVIYPLEIVPARLKRITGYRSLKDIPGSKDIFIALGWAFIIVLFPALGRPESLGWLTAASFIFIAATVSIRSVLLAILDIPGDRITGNDTLPILLGFDRTRVLLTGLLVIAAGLLTAGLATGAVARISAVFFLSLVYLAAAAAGYSERTAYQPDLFEGLVDLNFVVTGIIAGIIAL